MPLIPAVDWEGRVQGKVKSDMEGWRGLVLMHCFPACSSSHRHPCFLSHVWLQGTIAKGLKTGGVSGFSKPLVSSGLAIRKNGSTVLIQQAPSSVFGLSCPGIVDGQHDGWVRVLVTTVEFSFSVSFLYNNPNHPTNLTDRHFRPSTIPLLWIFKYGTKTWQSLFGEK